VKRMYGNFSHSYEIPHFLYGGKYACIAR
jgi:hypothetical protein